MWPRGSSVKFRRTCVIVLVCTIGAGAGAREDGADGERYIVTPFVDEATGGAAAQLSWMSSALAITVAQKLEEHPDLWPVYGEEILDGLTPEFDVVKVAHRAHELGARWVVGGSFSRPAWKSELKIRLWAVVDASDAVPEPTLRLVAESGSVSERNALFDQIDSNLLGVLQKAGWPADADSIARMQRRPTRDLYGYTLWGRAIDAYFGFGQTRDLDKAEKILKKALLIDPKFAEAHRTLGLVYVAMGQKERASSQYAYALSLRPELFTALVGQAHLFRLQGDRARAEELAERALELRPWDIEAREMLGELLWENADLDRALLELEKVTAVRPRHLGARRTLALIYAAKGDTTNLADELQKVEELAPDDVDVKLDLGSAYQRMGAGDKAIAAYEEVIRRQPKNVQAWKLLGDCYRRWGDAERAVGAYQKVMHLLPDDPRPYFLLGAAYEQTGNDVRAEAVFQDAQRFHRYLGEAWTNLGAIALRRGDLNKASWYLSRAVARSPERPKSHYNYALVLDAQKERDRALDELKTAGELDPGDAEIRYLSGVILLREGRLDEARKMFAEALRIRPDHEDARHNLALLEDLQKRYGGEHSAIGAQ